MPSALAIGMTEEQFWNSNPRRLKIYTSAYSKKLDFIDELLWTMGGYVHSAVTASVDQVLNGKKSKAEYVRESLRRNNSNQNNGTDSSTDSDDKASGLTEEQKLRQVEALFMSLEIRKHNFDMAKKLEEKRKSKENTDPKE